MSITRIKGVNFGSWLLMEGYILGGRNIPEHRFKAEFEKINGKRNLKEFERLFRDNYIREIDFKNASLINANTIRLPFNARLIDNGYSPVNKNGLSYIKKALVLAEKYKLKVILDLHAATGAQNCDWHADSDGKALFWQKESYRQRTLALWEILADTFKDYKALIGYDVLNEPVLDKTKVKILAKFYKDTVKKIRSIDKKHLIFLEGFDWGQRIDFLKDIIEKDVWVSIHTYLPLNYTFNFTPFLKFPGTIEGRRWDKNAIYKYLLPYYKFARENKTNIYVGEFGINWRMNNYGELDYLNSMLKTFEEFKFSYTYWTYKCVARHAFPDGIYQLVANDKFIKREGPVYGWENYISNWKRNKKDIVNHWKTESYTPNKQLINLLKRFFKM
ncbi:MAG: cellulase family glycosylhydrolase [Candidatus Gygaella obscura]|nr:cellulase family glycosylhydrolase [Candidatus Gygaella obscura]